jgi:hypothetical protein
VGRHTAVQDGPDNILNLMDATDAFSTVMQAVNDGRYVFGLHDSQLNDTQFVVNTDMGVMRAVWPPDDGDLPFITQLGKHSSEQIGHEFRATMEAVAEYAAETGGGDYIFFAGDQFDEDWL